MASVERLTEAVPEDDLLVGLRAGDESAFRTLVRRHHGSLVRVALSYVPSRAIAEEVAQDTWMAVVRGIHQFEGRSSLRTWIFRILENQARARGVREHRSVPSAALSGTSAAGSPSVDPGRFHGKDEAFAGYWAMPPSRWTDLPEERLSNAETLALVGRTISMLPSRQQQVVTLRDIEGWTAAEVCELLGLSEGNQRVLLHRARSHLRANLETHFSTVARA